MPEHKLSEQELQEIREEAEKECSISKSDKDFGIWESGYIAAATAERLRAKGLVEALERIERICLKDASGIHDMQKDFKSIYEITSQRLQSK